DADAGLTTRMTAAGNDRVLEFVDRWTPRLAKSMGTEEAQDLLLAVLALVQGVREDAGLTKKEIADTEARLASLSRGYADLRARLDALDMAAVRARAECPRYLVYDVGDHVGTLFPILCQEEPQLMDADAGQQVVVDLATRKRRWMGEWREIA
ncbi:MAG: hypothetical protein AABY22_33340, partial [Nanoarchaeota archaeon]